MTKHKELKYKRLTAEDLERTKEALHRNDFNVTAAARDLHLNESTLRERIKKHLSKYKPLSVAAQHGKLGFAPVLPGFRISKTSTKVSAEGETGDSWVQQRPDAGEAYVVPAGHIVKGESALVDPDGRVVSKWVKTRLEPIGLGMDAIREALAEFKGLSVPVTAPAICDDDLITVYNIGDHHTGAYSWKDETGADYDLEIAEKLLLNSINTLVERSPNSKTALVLGLGDFFHANNSRNQTDKSGHALDVDTRWCRVFRVGVNMAIQYIYAALKKHEIVKVRFLQGNHDPETSIALAIAISLHFDNNPRVQVDISPSKHFMMTFGRVMIAATHGDTLKPDGISGFMAANWPEDWGNTNFRYAYFGHVHHKSRGGGENYGVVWETFQVLAPKDAWHAEQGYSAGRSMTSITHHKEWGEAERHVVSISEKRVPSSLLSVS
jgi:hypothetical protein